MLARLLQLCKRPMARVAFYIDGFNLYHAIEALGKPQLKWLNLMALAASFVKQQDTIAKVRYFSAVQVWDMQKSRRHQRYLDALFAVGVSPTLSVFQKSNKYCSLYRRYCDFKEEKQTDVALAIAALSDAMDGIVDRAVFVTADSDHVPLIREVKRRFPEIDLLLAAPPGRLALARELGRMFPAVDEITEGRIAACLLPRDVYNAAGKKVATCPTAYLPQ